MALWVIELSEFDVQYRPQTALKGQIVADFIAEYTQSEDKGAKGQTMEHLHERVIKSMLRRCRCGYTNTRRR